jgi:hypothetical protein
MSEYGVYVKETPKPTPEPGFDESVFKTGFTEFLAAYGWGVSELIVRGWHLSNRHFPYDAIIVGEIVDGCLIRPKVGWRVTPRP